MILPTPAEVAALRAAAVRRFGSDKLLLVKLGAPVDAALVLATFGLKSYASHLEARQGNASTAAVNAVVDRVLWCSPEPELQAPAIDTLVPSKEDADPARSVALARLEELRETWPAVSAKVEGELRIAAGAGLGVFTASRLTADSVPRGFEVPASALASGPGSLWVARQGGADGLAIVMRQPLPDVWCAVKAQWLAAVQAKAGLLDPLHLVKEHVVWISGAESLDQIAERLPDVAINLVLPFLEMGGQAAESSGSFL